ncbi:MAG: class I SAM-dependent methyltransferase [Chlamydiales bacterium]
MDYDFNAQAAKHREELIGLNKQMPSALVKRQALEIMAELEGWCAEDKAAILVDLILKMKPATIVEIGVFGGKSLVPMACALKANQKGVIYGIDPWDPAASMAEVLHPDNKHYWSIVDHRGIMQGLIQKIEQHDLVDQIELIESTSEHAPLIYEIDILHIDGNHSEKTSFFDVNKWVPLVRKGGWIIFDDMKWHEQGVDTTAKATAWLDAHCIKFTEFTDVCTWGIWIKP